MKAHELLEGLLMTTNLLSDGPGKRFAKSVKKMVNESAVLNPSQWEEVQTRIIALNTDLEAITVTKAELSDSMAITT